MAYYLSEINARCRADAAGFIAECDGIYADRLELAADRIMENMEKSPIVLLSGPSGSGKTTTALKICEVLERRGVRTHSISMDNYFKSVSPETTPRTPEGKYDLESPLCMDMELLNEHFSVLSGNDALILKTLQNGGKGGITAVANILPEMMVSIYQNWKKGDMAAAEAAQQGIQPIRDCFKYGNPNSIVKRAANLIGQPLGPCRKPFGMVSEETDNAILDTIDRYYAAYKR